MPFINVKTNTSVSKEKMDAIKAQLGPARLRSNFFP